MFNLLPHIIGSLNAKPSIHIQTEEFFQYLHTLAWPLPHLSILIIAVQIFLLIKKFAWKFYQNWISHHHQRTQKNNDNNVLEQHIRHRTDIPLYRICHLSMWIHRLSWWITRHSVYEIHVLAFSIIVRNQFHTFEMLKNTERVW